MTTLPIPSGPTNREIINRAYQFLGLSDSMFGRTEQEYGAAMLALGAVMEEWPYDQLGFIVEDAAGLRVEEESGIARTWLNAVALALAENIGPELGKTLSREAVKLQARAYSRLCGAVASIPTAQYAEGTAKGAGHRWYGNQTFFVPVTKTEDEEAPAEEWPSV
jgi:hypothetical protein